MQKRTVNVGDMLWTSSSKRQRAALGEAISLASRYASNIRRTEHPEMPLTRWEIDFYDWVPSSLCDSLIQVAISTMEFAEIGEKIGDSPPAASKFLTTTSTIAWSPPRSNKDLWIGNATKQGMTCYRYGIEEIPGRHELDVVTRDAKGIEFTFGKKYKAWAAGNEQVFGVSVIEQLTQDSGGSLEEAKKCCQLHWELCRDDIVVPI